MKSAGPSPSAPRTQASLRTPQLPQPQRKGQRPPLWSAGNSQLRPPPATGFGSEELLGPATRQAQRPRPSQRRIPPRTAHTAPAPPNAQTPGPTQNPNG